MAEAQLTIYTTPTCAYCKAEKEWLDENDIEYEEIDASDPENAKEMVEVSGQMGVPVSVVGEDSVVIGFQKDKLADLLGIELEE